MASRKSIWFHIGHALERAKRPRAEPGTAVARRPRAPSREGERRTDLDWPAADELLSAATWLVLDKVLGAAGGRRRRPGLVRLAKAAAAGALAALLVDLVRPLLRGHPELPALDEETFERLAVGVTQGLVYGALVEPRVPGPALVKGVLYGSVEYLTDPAGGLSALLSSHTPHGRLPVVGPLLDGLSARDRAYLEHLVFGIALALLYDPSPSSNGTVRPSDGRA